MLYNFFVAVLQHFSSDQQDITQFLFNTDKPCPLILFFFFFSFAIIDYFCAQD